MSSKKVNSYFSMNATQSDLLQPSSPFCVDHHNAMFASKKGEIYQSFLILRKGEFLFPNECNSVEPSPALPPFFVDHHNVSRHCTGDLHLCQSQRLIFRHKRVNGMKTFLGFVHNGIKVESKETHLAFWAKKRRRRGNKELPPDFNTFPYINLLASSRQKTKVYKLFTAMAKPHLFTKVITNT